MANSTAEYTMEDYDYKVLWRDADRDTKSMKCVVTGEFPSWLTGCVMYNGPGKLSVSDKHRFCHTFDSLALLQRFNFKNGDVYYASKFLDSYIYKECIESKTITRAGFATPGPERSLFARLSATTDSDKMYSDNANLSIIKMGNRFLAVAEVPIVFEIDGDTFEVIDRININKEFGIVIQSVHFAEHNGKYVTIGQTFGLMGSKYVILEIPACGSIRKMKIVSTIAPKYRFQPSHIHEMGLSKNYAIIPEHPLQLSMGDLVRDIFTATPFINSVHWSGDKIQFRVFDNKTWKPVSQSFVADPFFMMHFSNIYEEDNKLVFEAAAYKDSKLLSCFFVKHLDRPKEEFTKEEEQAFFCTLKRFVIPLDMKLGDEQNKILGTQCNARTDGKQIHLEGEVMSEEALNQPCINPRFHTKKHRYVWGTSFPSDGSNCGFLNKVDLTTKQHILQKKQFYHTSNIVFVPTPGGVDEDDGILLCHNLRADNEHLVQMIAYDAKDLTEIASALADTNNCVPLPMHASYFS